MLPLCLNLRGILLFPKQNEHRVNLLVRFMNLVAGLGPGQNYLSTCKDQENYLRFLHFVNETGKEFGFVVTAMKFLMGFLKRLQLYAEAYVARCHYVLNLEGCHIDCKS